MSEANQSIKEAARTPKVQHFAVSKATVTRFRERQQAHYQAAQRLSSSHGKNDQVSAHMNMADACGHVAQSVEHSVQGQHELAAHALNKAAAAYQSAVSDHRPAVQEYGTQLRQALGHMEPQQMAKADNGPHEGELPHCPEHLHVQLPSGQRVHPMSAEGVAHIQKTVVDPASHHGTVLEAHLGHLMRGLDTTITHRVKAADSLAKKVGRSGLAAHQMNDILGARVTVNNPAHFGEAQRRLQEHQAGIHPLAGHGINLNTEDDRNKDTPASGYRSVHYLGTTHGTNSEVQLRKPHQNVWSDWTHDNFYKDDALKKHLDAHKGAHEIEAVRQAGELHAKQVADHLEETGGKRGAHAPTTPPILEKYGLGFPWHKLKDSHA